MRITRLFFLIFTTVLFSNSLHAQDSINYPLLPSHKKLPVLNGLRYMSSDLLRGPFLDTHVRFRIGSGEAIGLNSYVRTITGEVRDTVTGDLSYISGDLEFQYAVNEWLGIFVGYGGAARLGSNVYTILSSGISYTTNLTLGAKVLLIDEKDMLLATSLDYTSSSVTLYSIYEFVKDVYESGEIFDTSASMLSTEHLSKTFINANYAYAFNNYVGMLAVMGWGLGRTFESKYRGNLRVGLAATWDFANYEPLSFPVGIMAGIRYNTYSETGENIKNVVTFVINLGYTGHKDFDIGIESIYQNLDFINGMESIKGILTSFKIQYFF